MPRNSSINQQGFTLIETIIYIALFALVMTAILLATHQLIESTSKTQIKAHVEGEAQFVLYKIDQAMNGATAISGTASSLTVTNSAFSGGQAVFELDGANIQLSGQTLNGSIAPVTSLTFSYDPPTAPHKQVTITFVVTSPLLTNPMTYTSTRVIRN